MSDLRLGDVIDDYCIKCRRLTNHSIVSMVSGEVAKVRCRSCYHDHDYLREQAPPSKKDLKKAELFNAVLGGVDPSAVAGPTDPVDPELLDEAEEIEAVPEPEPEPEPVAPAPKKKGRAKKA
jgi:hypothetical protein